MWALVCGAYVLSLEHDCVQRIETQHEEMCGMCGIWPVCVAIAMNTLKIANNDPLVNQATIRQTGPSTQDSPY